MVASPDFASWVTLTPVLPVTEILRLEPLTAEAFEPFGQVLQTRGHESRSINQGLTDKFGGLAVPELGASGRGRLSIYRSRPVTLPFPLRELERHRGLSQAFMPLHNRQFPIVVAGGGRQPGKLRAFLTDGRQGVCLHPGTWHHHQLSLEEVSEYLVVESRDNDSRTEVFDLPEGLLLQA